jgi:hypothetical protein
VNDISTGIFTTNIIKYFKGTRNGSMLQVPRPVGQPGALFSKETNSLYYKQNTLPWKAPIHLLLLNEIDAIFTQQCVSVCSMSKFNLEDEFFCSANEMFLCSKSIQAIQSATVVVVS